MTQKRRTIKDLHRIVEEADMLLAKRDGIHSMHGARHGIAGWVSCHAAGLRIDWENVDTLIDRMRRCGKTGRYER